MLNCILASGDYSIYENAMLLPYDIGYSTKDINHIKRLPGVKNVLPYNIGNLFLDINKKCVDKSQTDVIDNYEYVKYVLYGLTVKSTIHNNITLKGYFLGCTQCEKIPTACLYYFVSQKNDLTNENNKFQLLSYSIVIVIFIISLLNIINTLYQNVIKHTPEIGMMRAVGMTGYQLRKFILMEGIIYGVTSSVLTFLSGTIAIPILSKCCSVKIFFDWNIIAFMCITNLIIGIAATLLPCRKISKINILDSQKPF